MEFLRLWRSWCDIGNGGFFVKRVGYMLLLLLREGVKSIGKLIWMIERRYDVVLC